MKKSIMMSLVALMVLSSVNCFAKGRACHKQSDYMKPADAIAWTMVNPSECGMEFFRYCEVIKEKYEKLTSKEKKGMLIQKLIQKHVSEMENEISKEAHGMYYAALDYEGYYSMLLFFKKQGYKTQADEVGLRAHLQNRAKERCQLTIQLLRSGADKTMSSNFHVEEICEMMKKYGITYKDFGATEAEIKRFAYVKR